jgi:hypothetical protein
MTRGLCALLCSTGAALAEESKDDKAQYNLFHPTPTNLLRELSTDRPDTTESAYSVDAGHLQFEMNMVAYTRDRHTEDRDGGFEAWSFADTNIKLGLTNWSDLQVVVPVHESVRHGPRGFGDISIRLKTNLWGNDGGPTALAVMPFVKIPTASDGLGNGEVEGGLIVPFGADLPGEWGFGAMVEVDFLADDEGSGRKTELVATITFSHPIVGELGGWVEFVSVAGVESDWAAFLNGGLTYGINDNAQLDAGVNVGLTRTAEDLTTFVGLSFRF